MAELVRAACDGSMRGDDARDAIVDLANHAGAYVEILEARGREIDGLRLRIVELEAEVAEQTQLAEAHRRISETRRRERDRLRETVRTLRPALGRLE